MLDLARMVQGILAAPFPPTTTEGAPVATKTATRIYQVTQNTPAKDGEPAKPFVRLVRATHPGHALRHVAEGILTVEVAGPEDVYKAAKAGIEVEDIGGTDGS